MSKKLLVILILYIYSSSGYDALSQEVSIKTVALSIILEELEEQFDVKFSYQNKVVRDVTLFNLPYETDLNATLANLERMSGLLFERLNDRFIVIKENTIYSEVQELDNIYISNLLASGISKSSSGVTLIKPSKFGILPGIIEPDILQAVQALPGILSTEETVSDLNIRGGTNDQNLILWDGIKMYQSGHFFGLISAFNPYLTDRVEVLKNGTSARYGDGISGTLKITLDDKNYSKTSGALSSNLIHIKGFTKLPISKKSTLLLSARRSTTDFLYTPTYENYTRRIFQDTDLNPTQVNDRAATGIDFYFYDVNAKFIYDITKKDALRISATTIFNDLNYNEATSQEGNTERSGIRQGTLGFNTVYKRKWTSAFETDISIYASNYNLSASNFDLENNQQLEQENQVLDLGFKLQSSYRVFKNLVWNNGYQYSEVGTRNLARTNNPAFFRNEKEVITTQALYSEVSYLSNNKTTQIIGGVRANYLSPLSNFIIEPRLRMSQRIFDYFKLNFQGEFKSQSTFQIIDQPNDFLGIERRRWVSSNAIDLPVIQSKQGSAGIDFTKNKWLISTEAYLKQVDGITSRSQGFQNQFRFRNATGSYDVMGVDLLLSKRFTSFSTWLSYSYTQNDYQFTTLNNGISFPNNTDVRHALRFGSSYTKDDFKISLGFNWRSGTPITLPQSDDPIVNGTIQYELPNAETADSFLRFDISTIYNFKLFDHNFQVGASVWNILDNTNVINTYYYIDEDSALQKATVKSLGFTPNFTIKYSF